MSMKEKLEKAKKLLEILGNETRIEILRLLSEKQCYVSEISRELDIGQQAILRHLKLLSEWNLLSCFEEEVEDDEKRGRGRKRKYYTISDNNPFNLFIKFDDDEFNIQLETEIEEESKPDLKSEPFTAFPELKEIEDEKNSIIAEQDLIEKLRKIRDLTARVKNLVSKYQEAINYLKEVLRQLNLLKEHAKDSI